MTATAPAPVRYVSVVPAIERQAEIRFDLDRSSGIHALTHVDLIASVRDLAEETAQDGSYSVTVTDTLGEHSSTCGIDESGYLQERFFPYAIGGYVADVLCCHTHRTILVVVGKV